MVNQTDTMIMNTIIQFHIELNWLIVNLALCQSVLDEV